MKSLFALSLLASALVPSAVLADTSREELRRDRQDVREEGEEYKAALRYGNRRDIREERDEYSDARREYREDMQDWREDRRGDYRGEHRGHGRDHHRGASRGRWSAPFGYSAYRPGARMHRDHYGSRYAMNENGLPRAYGGTRWIRHYDDALLVDLRTGTVRRVIRGFYW